MIAAVTSAPIAIHSATPIHTSPEPRKIGAISQ